MFEKGKKFFCLRFARTNKSLRDRKTRRTDRETKWTYTNEKTDRQTVKPTADR